MSYSALLGLRPSDVVAIVGSGGKTSLLFRLAAEHRGRRVLVSTTTKMLLPTAEEIEGIRLLHGGAPGGKIIAPPMERLAAACGDAELTLLECDGANMLPLKGWAAHEPVVPDFATITVGVLPLWALGRPVGPELVHRVAQFCALTGAKPGEPVTTAHLAAVVSHPAGLFRAARGRRVLFLNERQGASGAERAEAIAAALDSDMCVLAGDVRMGTVRRVVRGAAI